MSDSWYYKIKRIAGGSFASLDSLFDSMVLLCTKRNHGMHIDGDYFTSCYLMVLFSWNVEGFFHRK